MLLFPSLVTFVCGLLFPVGAGHMSASTARGVRDSLPHTTSDSLIMTSPDAFSPKSLRQLLVDEGKHARALKRTPFLELGATWCAPCQALQALLDTKPTNPVVRDEFAGTYIIRLDVDQYQRELDSIGFHGTGIPIFLSIDTTGMVTDSTSATQWGGITLEALRAAQRFFKAHAWQYDVPTTHKRTG